MDTFLTAKCRSLYVNRNVQDSIFIGFESLAHFLPYSRFQVTFQSLVAKFVLNIPNYITKFGILRENLQSEICMLVN